MARGFNEFASVLSGINHSTADSESTSGLPPMSSRVPTQPSPCHCAASRNTTGGEISPLGTRVPIAEGESRFAEALGGKLTGDGYQVGVVHEGAVTMPAPRRPSIVSLSTRRAPRPPCGRHLGSRIALYPHEMRRTR